MRMLTACTLDLLVVPAACAACSTVRYEGLTSSLKLGVLFHPPNDGNSLRLLRPLIMGLMPESNVPPPNPNPAHVPNLPD